jgi:hypothetical protein
VERLSLKAEPPSSKFGTLSSKFRTLYSKSGRLYAEGGRLYAEGGRLYAEGGRLYAFAATIRLEFRETREGSLRRSRRLGWREREAGTLHVQEGRLSESAGELEVREARLQERGGDVSARHGTPGEESGRSMGQGASLCDEGGTLGESKGQVLTAVHLSLSLQSPRAKDESPSRASHCSVRDRERWGG